MIQLKPSRAPFYWVTLIMCFAATFSISVNADSLPHTFSAGTPAKAEEVNQNFSHLEQRIQNLEEPSDSSITEGVKQPITGTVSIYSGDTKTVHGKNTLFSTELTEGGIISLEGKAFQIASIDSDIELTLASWFGSAVSDVTAYTVDYLQAIELDKQVIPVINNGGYLVRRIQRVTGNDQVVVLSPNRYVPNRKLDFYKLKKDSDIRITYTDWVTTVFGTPCYFEIKVDQESCSSPKPVRYFNADYNQGGFSEVLYCKTSKSGSLSVEVYVNSGCLHFGHDDFLDGQRIDTFWSLEAEEVY